MLMVLFIFDRNVLVQVISSEDAWHPVAFWFGQLSLLARRYSPQPLAWVSMSCDPAEWVQ